MDTLKNFKKYVLENFVFLGLIMLKTCMSVKNLLDCTLKSSILWKQVISRASHKIKMEKKLSLTKRRSNPAVKKIDSPEFQSIFTKELTDLAGIFQKYGYELRIAGGAARDILMEMTPKDIDFATTATPEEMKKMFTLEKIRMINTKGELHGTITPRINDKENFEITTLRIDTETDGRHAKVEFSKSWELDAYRRDLTINSMFLGLDGTLYDYFFGYEDVLERKVRFVGDPDDRIKEDYLRILRYFRFYGRIAKEPNKHLENTLEIIKQNAQGLSRVSAERIWMELRKILCGNFRKELMLDILNCDLGGACGLPKKPNLEEFERFCSAIQNFEEPHPPVLYLIALLNNEEEAFKLNIKLKLPAFERDMVLFFITNRDKVDSEFVTLLDYKVPCAVSIDIEKTKMYMLNLLKYKNKKDFYEELKDWKIPKLSLNFEKLKSSFGDEAGSAGKIIKLKWAQSDFALSWEEIVEKHLPEIKSSLEKLVESSPKVKRRKL